METMLTRVSMRVNCEYNACPPNAGVRGGHALSLRLAFQEDESAYRDLIAVCIARKVVTIVKP